MAILKIRDENGAVAEIPVLPGEGVPAVTTADNGKFLRVVDGKWAAVTVTAEELT